MLTQLTSRLASQLNDLTIQVVKEDWTLTSTPTTLPPSPSAVPAVPNPYLPASIGVDGATNPLPTAQGQHPKLPGTQEVPLPSPQVRGALESSYPHYHGAAQHTATPMTLQGQEGQFVGGGLNLEPSQSSLPPVPHSSAFTTDTHRTQVI